VTGPLHALGWDHPRCVAPMDACTQAWVSERGTDIVWDWRSLTAFGDQSPAEVASAYDVVIIDHPFCGTAATTGSLAPLDELVSAHRLAELAADSIGPSHGSYSYGGHQWALAADAACQVTAVRDDLLGEIPIDTWDAVLELARARPGRVALPLSPPHAISSWLTLVANARGPLALGPTLTHAEVGMREFELLRELASLGPTEALTWEPPDALARLTQNDELDCIPLTYGYVTYSRPGSVARPCTFTDIPSAGYGPVGSVLGGAGIAVSSSSRRPAEAAAFAVWASGADVQRRLVAPSGGQPASRTAWLDPAVDAAAGGFYSGTRATIEAAWVRPRDPWWPAFQREAGDVLNAALAGAIPAATAFARLDDLYRECLRRRT
jgi:multiple sugar transport system substrate-binding protein